MQQIARQVAKLDIVPGLLTADNGEKGDISSPAPGTQYMRW